MPNLDLADTSISEDDPLWVHVTSDGVYRYVMFANEVHVYKSGDTSPTYTITRLGGCDCPSAMYRSKVCKHMRTIGVVGEESTVTPASSGADTEVTSLIEEL